MTKNKGGRPRIKIDWHIVNSLCEIWCTGEEVASVLGISYDTLNRGCKREFGVGFAEYYKMENMEQRITIGLGSIMVVGIAALAAVIKFL